MAVSSTASVNTPGSKGATGEQTVSITFTGVCGVPWRGTHVSHQYRFSYLEQAPQSLCNRARGEPDPDPDATGRFLTELVERHNHEILQARPWSCQICGAEAKELYHSAIQFLNPGILASDAFKPSVWDTVIPICKSAGACDRKAGDIAYAFAKKAIPELRKPKNGCCDRCGNVKGIKLCSGCKCIG